MISFDANYVLETVSSFMLLIPPTKKINVVSSTICFKWQGYIMGIQ